jgi:hypothetical protein
MGVREIGGGSGDANGAFLPNPNYLQVSQANDVALGGSSVNADAINGYGASLSSTVSTRETIADVTGEGLFYGAFTAKSVGFNETMTLWITIDGTEYKLETVTTAGNRFIVGCSHTLQQFGSSQAQSVDYSDTTEAAPSTTRAIDVGPFNTPVKFNQSLKVEHQVSNNSGDVRCGAIYRVA